MNNLFFVPHDYKNNVLTASDYLTVFHSRTYYMYVRNARLQHRFPFSTQAKVSRCVEEAMKMVQLQPSDLAAVGITNQRESTLMWDKNTGKPLHRLIVWNDVRTENICR